MVAIAELSGKREIIFPEMAALAVGGWISSKQPWISSKRKMFALMSLASIAGVLIVKFAAVPMIVQVAMGFIFAAAALMLTRTTLLPIISACILPIYMQTDTWVYPISVTIMSVIIVSMQWVMDKMHIRRMTPYKPVEFDIKSELLHWTKLFVLLMLISIVPVYSRHFYFIAPPLIVAFAEFANVKSPLRKKPFKVIALLTFTAFIGAYLRLVLNSYFHLPLFICAVIACSVLFLVFEKVRTFFPPAGAILLLPLILNADELLFYPLEILIGSSILILLAIMIFRDKMPKFDF